MDDLITWLRAQLDEDEQIARSVKDNSAPWDGQWKPDGERAVRTYNDWVLAYGQGGRDLPRGFSAHVARHDPARVLREVEAKRKIIKLHSPGSDPCDAHDASLRSVPCEVIELLALPFSDRPGYREEWRP